MSSRKPFVAGNWKMNLLRAEARALAGAVARAAARRPDVDCGVFPAFTSLDMVRVALEGTRVILGGQACHASSRGAHTGEISAPMLVDAGCRAVLCGHSERRAAGESDAAVGACALAAVSVGLRAVVCVGEQPEQLICVINE
jgi:triosephosphate isomerase